ncbi:MAG: ABC transporter permease [Trueperaceae bacterium]
MTVYIARRFLGLIPVLAIIAVIAFFILRVAPGDPTAMLLPQDASAEDIDRLRERLGLNRPLPIQFFEWFGSLVTGDFGISFHSRSPVLETIAQRVTPTIWLAVSAQLFAILVAIPGGIIAAIRQNSWWDKGVTLFALGGVAIPNFWFGMLLVMLVSINLRWLPSQGFVDPFDDPINGIRRLILPTITLGYAQAAQIMRMTRSSMLDVMRLDYVRTARAKGLQERTTLFRHALINAMNPIITVIGFSVASLLSGAIVVELVFNYPGIGQLVVEAVGRRDFPLIQGVLVLLAAMTLVVNFFVDVSYSIFDPRIRYE